MLRLFFTVILLINATRLAADEPGPFKLSAPAGWGGETIQLPPGFARDMSLKGLEHIRFAPGMMKPESESFFSYAFVFELQPKPELSEEVIKDDLLKYYRGLCKAVVDGKVPDLDPSKFSLQLQPVKVEAKASSDDKAAKGPTEYTGTLDWIEPFATKKPQKLNLEIQIRTTPDRNDIFVCVSPLARDAELWKQLHKIRDDYWKK